MRAWRVIWMADWEWDCELGLRNGTVDWKWGMGLWTGAGGWDYGLGLWTGEWDWEWGMGLWNGEWSCGLRLGNETRGEEMATY
jgi:hypothetical protein